MLAIFLMFFFSLDEKISKGKKEQKNVYQVRKKIFNELKRTLALGANEEKCFQQKTSFKGMTRLFCNSSQTYLKSLLHSTIYLISAQLENLSSYQIFRHLCCKFKNRGMCFMSFSYCDKLISKAFHFSSVSSYCHSASYNNTSV